MSGLAFARAPSPALPMKAPPASAPAIGMVTMALKPCGATAQPDFIGE